MKLVQANSPVRLAVVCFVTMLLLSVIISFMLTTKVARNVELFEEQSSSVVGNTANKGMEALTLAGLVGEELPPGE